MNGFRLPIGAETEGRLRQEVHEAKAFIGLITPSSMASAYVMFELGARWGARLHLAPLLGAGAGTEYLRGPLASLNALKCEDAAQVHQLISDLADVLAVQNTTRPAVYEELVTKLVATSKADLNHPALPSPNQPIVGTSDAQVGHALVGSSSFQLRKDDVEVLKLFSKDRTSIAHKVVASTLNMHSLKAEQICERLQEHKLLTAVGGSPDSTFYKLTKEGRDYLVEHDLLTPPIAAKGIPGMAAFERGAAEP